MPRLNLEQIKEELAKSGWQVLSDKYKNLTEPMQFLCSQGHEVTACYGDLRKDLYCPQCRPQFLDLSDDILPPEKGKTRVLALDQATHKTGWAILDGSDLRRCGVFETSGTTDELVRMHEIKEWLQKMIDSWHPVTIGLEGIQFEQSAGMTTYQTLARLQGILMDLCYENGIKYDICHTATWRAYCGVGGESRKEKKAIMQSLIKQWYHIEVSDDCADAIGIGRYTAAQQRPTMISFK